jgi:hypothetical protein
LLGLKKDFRRRKGTSGARPRPTLDGWKVCFPETGEKDLDFRREKFLGGFTKPYGDDGIIWNAGSKGFAVRSDHRL